MQLKIDEKKYNFYLTALLMMIPMTVQGLMDNFIILFNTFICVKFNNNHYLTENIIAGIGSQTSIFEIVWYGLIGIVISGNVFTSQYYGAKDYFKVRETMNVKLCYMVGFALISIIIVESLTPEIINTILGGVSKNDNSQNNAIEIGIYYTRIVAISYPLLAISYCFVMTMNALGKIKITLLSSGVGIITNLIISLCFGFIGNHGIMFKITGLALGIIFSWTGSTLVYIFYFIITKSIYRPMINIFYITKDMHKKMIKTSIPNVINNLATGIAFAIQITIFVHNGTGPETLAALQIVLTISTLLFSIFRPLNGLISFFVGKELGANNTYQAKINAKKIMNLVFVISLIFSLLLLSMSLWVPQCLYSHLTQKTKDLASWYLYFIPISFLCTIIIQLVILILGIGGYQTQAAIANITMQWLLDVLIVFLLFLLGNLDIKIVLMIGCLLKIIEVTVMFILYKVLPWNRNFIHNK